MKPRFKFLLLLALAASAASLLAGNQPTIVGAISGVPGADQQLVTDRAVQPLPFATGKAKFLGSAYNTVTSQALGFEQYWNQVTPENAGKWGSVEAIRNVMNWTALDAAYSFATSHGFPFKFHNLIWGNQQPTWIRSLPADQQLAELNQWFAAVAARYPDLAYIDVVNEPLHDPPDGQFAGNVGTTDCGNYIQALGGSGATGWDWVITAFQMARQYFPNAKLILNEYSVTNDASAAANYVQIIQLLNSRNLVDAIGIQEHAFETRMSADTTKANLDTIAATGLPIYITELDIDGPTDQIQLDDYRRIFPVFWEHPAVQGITLWGYRPGMWRTAQGANLVLADGTEKPAMQWLRTYVQNNPPVVPAGQVLGVRTDAATGATVGTAQATDADANTTFQDWRITGGTGATVFAISSATGQITVANAAALTAASHTLNVSVSDGLTTSAAGTITIYVTNAPVITAPPAAQAVALSGSATLAATVSGSGPFTYQWKKNGVDLLGAASPTLALTNIQPSDAGIYSVAVSNSSGTALSAGAIVGPQIQSKVVGTAYEHTANIVHPNGNIYDQILLTGSAATVTADPGQVVRTSYVDLNDDIVQVEFSGAGSLTIALASTTGPAIAVNYNQPSVEYMKGHASLTLVGADENTHLSVFTVGPVTAVNQTLFKPGTTYDGVADLALLAVSSPTGRLGSIRFADADFFAVSGFTGVYAPGVRIGGPANIHNLAASDAATPLLVTGSIDTGRIGITGGDMLQPNARPIQVEGVQAIAMLAGATSQNVPLPAQTNRGVYERNGLNVTTQLIQNP